MTFEIKPGEFVGVLGASGSGKSTLIKLLAGLVELSHGEIRFAGLAATADSLRADGRIAYLPQDVVIHEQLTPRVALGYIARLKDIGRSDVERNQRVHHVLERVGIADRLDVPIRQLSGGQRKRVALAAELLGDPHVILLDEATSGLDPATEEEMMRLFHSLAQEGRTVVCITHFPSRLHMCDKLLYLMHGKAIFYGAPAELTRFFGVESIEDTYTKQHERPAEEWEASFHRLRGHAVVSACGRSGSIAQFVRACVAAGSSLNAADARPCLAILPAPIRGLEEPAAPLRSGPGDRTDGRDCVRQH